MVTDEIRNEIHRHHFNHESEYKIASAVGVSRVVVHREIKKLHRGIGDVLSRFGVSLSDPAGWLQEKLKNVEKLPAQLYGAELRARIYEEKIKHMLYGKDSQPREWGFPAA